MDKSESKEINQPKSPTPWPPRFSVETDQSVESELYAPYLHPWQPHANLPPEAQFYQNSSRKGSENSNSYKSKVWKPATPGWDAIVREAKAEARHIGSLPDVSDSDDAFRMYEGPYIDPHELPEHRDADIPPVLCSYGNQADRTLEYLPVGVKLSYYAKPPHTDAVRLTTKYYVFPNLGVDKTSRVCETSLGFWSDERPPMVPPHSPHASHTNIEKYESMRPMGFWEKAFGMVGSGFDRVYDYILSTCNDITTTVTPTQ